MHPALVRASEHESAHAGYFHLHGVPVLSVAIDAAGSGATAYDDATIRLSALQVAHRMDPKATRMHVVDVVAALMAGAIAEEAPVGPHDAALIESLLTKWTLVAGTHRDVAGMLELAQAWATRWVRHRLSSIHWFASDLRAQRRLRGAELQQRLAKSFPTPSPRKQPYVY
jgi:hypothetical protein